MARPERGIYVWRDNLETARALLRSYRSGASGSPFAVADERLGDLDAAARAAFRERVDELVAGGIDPALESLEAFLGGDYAAATPDQVGAVQLPDGEEWYRYRVRAMTTMDVAPENIHERGTALVAEMEADMAAPA